jgi:DNA-directed RNA polymerase specialized sigma24 family protein
MRADRLNALYADYLINREVNLEPLLEGVRRVALRMLHDDDDAQELTKTVSDKLPSLEVTGSFAAFLHRLAIWRRIDYRRSRQSQQTWERQPPVMFDISGDRLSDVEVLDLLAANNTPGDDPYPDLTVISDPLVRRIAELLLEGFTQGEIAHQLEMRPGTVRQRIRRYRASQLKKAA